MKNRNTKAEKIFLGVGIITIISGIFLILDGDYLIGITGAIVGAWLTFENWKKLKNK